ncbi:MAG: ATP-binding protein [Desulfobacterales bacterium]|nr:ATP-binding protein [Desulfobacterales bacterium]
MINDGIFNQLCLPEYREGIQAELAALSKSRPRCDFEFKIQRLSDGSILDLYGVAEYHPDQEKTSGIIQDVTERKQNEEALAALRSYLSDIIDSMPSILIGVSKEGRITLWNSRAGEETGILSQEAVGQPLDAAIPRLGPMLDMVREAVENGTVCHRRQETQLPQGEPLHESVTVYPLGFGEMEGAVIRVDNISEQTRMEEMMVQSEKMLSVGGLAAGTAHEINNPLAGILQTSSVMRDRLSRLDIPASQRAAREIGVDLAQIKEYMEKREIFSMLNAITDSGRRVAEIVESMLSFARKSDGAVSSHYPDRLLDSILTLAEADYDLKKHYDFKQIQIVKEYDSDLPMLPCQSGKIQQVVLNILRNAAQAMQPHSLGDPRESPKITLRLQAQTLGEDRFLCIEIQDNGPGIPLDIQKRVFEPFFTTKPVGEGTGLGLSVSYFIVTENHGGHLELESNPGGGARFIIRLPV